MQLVTFEIGSPLGPQRRTGAVRDDTIIDLALARASLIASTGRPRAVVIGEAEVPSDMLELLRGGPWALDAAREAVEHAATEGVDTLDGATVRHPASAVRLLAPLPRPNSLRDFLVIEEHLRNARRNAGLEEMPGPEWYKLPAHYKGNVDAIYGPDDEVPYPAYTAQFDYELEICAVVGSAGRRVRAEDATPYIAGFTHLQRLERPRHADARVERRHRPGDRQGPRVVTRAVHRHRGRVGSRHRPPAGAHRRRAVVGRHAGRDALLLRGHHRVRDDGGDAAARRPARERHDRARLRAGAGRFLRPGSVVELEAEGIGVLRNTVGAKTDMAVREDWSPA